MNGGAERDPSKPQFSIGQPKPGQKGIINIQIHGNRFDGSELTILGFTEIDGEAFANFEVYSLNIDGDVRTAVDENDPAVDEFRNMATHIAEDLIEMGLKMVQQAKTDETGAPADFDPSILERSE